MHHDYKDIRALTPIEPKWFDEHAVPRYCEFHPTEISDIYADETALVLIQCQACAHKFEVAFSTGRSQRLFNAAAQLSRETDPRSEEAKIVWAAAEAATLAKAIRDKILHYGDPPNIGCCGSGPTMSSDPDRVLQYWRRVQFEWMRDPTLEVLLDD